MINYKKLTAIQREKKEKKNTGGRRGTKEKERLADTVSLILVPLITYPYTNKHTPTKPATTNKQKNTKQ